MLGTRPKEATKVSRRLQRYSEPGIGRDVKGVTQPAACAQGYWPARSENVARGTGSEGAGRVLDGGTVNQKKNSILKERKEEEEEGRRELFVAYCHALGKGVG